MKILKLKGMFARSNRLLKNAFSALSVLIFSCGIISEARAEVTCVWSETNPTELIVSGEGILTGGTYGVCPAGFASTVTSVTFAEGSNITEIDSHAFYGASKLTGIDLPNTFTRNLQLYFTTFFGGCQPVFFQFSRQFAQFIKIYEMNKTACCFSLIKILEIY